VNILVVGGGPAGLYFSYLLKKRQPEHTIRVVEQNPRGATYGWGVVFSGVALDAIRAADDEFFADFIDGQESCEYIEVVHRKQGVRIHGNQFSRTPRLDLLAKLEAACERVGVEMEWNRSVSASEIDASWDLVVAANGNNSNLRSQFEREFGTRIETRRNYFAWYGTKALFHPVSLIFVPTQWGTFISHCYQYSTTHSTFLVECSPETWVRAGLDKMPEEDSRAFCARVFSEELDGEPLLGNRSSWFRANIVTNERASHDRFILIGDAYRTVHFSLGSGTRMAMQDAMALSAAVEGAGGDARAALSAFDNSRRPASAEFQEAAARSLDWYESVDTKLHLSPLAFTYDYMTRTGKVTRDDLRKMDPAFVAEFEQDAQAAASGAELLR
jgi:anthraniloyl-CoA monooxygenase